MRKVLIATFVAAVFLGGAATASAQSYSQADLNRMSRDELISLRDDLALQVSELSTTKHGVPFNGLLHGRIDDEFGFKDHDKFDDRFGFDDKFDDKFDDRFGFDDKFDGKLASRDRFDDRFDRKFDDRRFGFRDDFDHRFGRSHGFNRFSRADLIADIQIEIFDLDSGRRLDRFGFGDKFDRFDRFDRSRGFRDRDRDRCDRGRHHRDRDHDRDRGRHDRRRCDRDRHDRDRHHDRRDRDHRSRSHFSHR